MIAILWLMAILTLVLGVSVLIPGVPTKISEMINKVFIKITGEAKTRIGAAICLLLVSAYTFFLIYYYTR